MITAVEIANKVMKMIALDRRIPHGNTIHPLGAQGMQIIAPNDQPVDIIADNGATKAAKLVTQNSDPPRGSNTEPETRREPLGYIGAGTGVVTNEERVTYRDICAVPYLEGARIAQVTGSEPIIEDNLLQPDIAGIDNHEVSQPRWIGWVEGLDD